jgi:hypothetical protein
MWEMACQSAGLPVVPRDAVIGYWKQYIGGQSRHSSIAINGDIDPKYTTLGIAWEGKLTAAHTTRTTSLLERVLIIFAKCFSSRAEFLDAMEKVSNKVSNKIFPEKAQGSKPKAQGDES